MGSREPMAFVSVVSRSHLPQARVLGAGLRRHHPDAQLYLLVTDFEATAEQTAPFQPINLKDLPATPALTDMTFYYDPFDLCNGLRGPLHRYMLEKTTAQRWAYLDTDMMCLGN